MSSVRIHVVHHRGVNSARLRSLPIRRKTGVRFGSRKTFARYNVDWELASIDETAPLALLSEAASIHDFSVGPIVEPADYQNVLAQMTKLRMNFIGFHTYPLESIHRP